MTVSLRGHDNSNYGQQSSKKYVCKREKALRQEVTEQMWYAAEDCSRSVQRWLEKLGRRSLIVVSGE